MSSYKCAVVVGIKSRYLAHSAGLRGDFEGIIGHMASPRNVDETICFIDIGEMA